MPPDRIVHVTIHGRVQGVGFRAWVHHQAELHGLEGWVRNRRDGTLEAAFAGTTDAVEAMLRACRTGPAGSRVENVDVEPGAGSLIPHLGSGRFEVLGTI
jgi:acylphosphatase